MMLDTPCWVSNERSRTAGAAAGISGRVAFAACWAGMPIKAFAKIATPRRIYSGFFEFVYNAKKHGKALLSSLLEPIIS